MRKIRVNAASLGPYRLNVDVYIDGEKTLRCMEADEAEGVAWVCKTHSKGDTSFTAMAMIEGKPGDFVIDGALVERVTGRVEIRFTGITNEDVARDEIAAHFIPCSIVQIVQ